MKACPDCGGDLGVKANKCRCGWKAASVLSSESNPNHIQCACDTECRKPGRISPSAEGLPGYLGKDRVCVDHYYRLLETVRSAA